MARYFVHQRSPTVFIEDQEGEEQPDLESAVREAVLAAREIMSERVLDGRIPDRSQFEISDACGVIQAVVPFAETLSATGGPAVAEPRWIRVVC